MPAPDEYAYVLDIPTRWKDNDVYGHVNNVVYLSFFDTVINTFLITRGELNIHDGPVIGLCVESHCRYDAPLAFPGTVRAGLAVERMGRSSVKYSVALFDADGDVPAARGSFVHVFVDRQTRRPSEVPAPIRRALEPLVRLT